MIYEATADRHKNLFLLSSLPAFLRGSVAMVVEAILFGYGYAASGGRAARARVALYRRSADLQGKIVVECAGILLDVIMLFDRGASVCSHSTAKFFISQKNR